tara:strand:+ start:131 stop:421 length:291 start_codon:yes stop_codon:yes gene_type:complete
MMLVPLAAMMLSVSPAYAGKDKTYMAWFKQIKIIKSSVSDKEALAKSEELTDKMTEGKSSMSRSKYYALAYKMFTELKALSEQNGGKTIQVPYWLK